MPLNCFKIKIVGNLLTINKLENASSIYRSGN